ncbi:MAG TPA: Gfo/Idh/MocA family oxidoreductase, partial [Propionibacteriaceae bacterium]|nr:Gfo/Idh/MocA family oxidoreductase [Propionibacteriaceae bacterium]
MAEVFNVLVVGCGGMGASHARAYHHHEGFTVVGLVAPSVRRRVPLAAELGGVAEYDSYEQALAET